MDTVCPECDGSGSLVLVGCAGNQHYREEIGCPLCQGSGHILSRYSKKIISRQLAPEDAGMGNIRYPESPAH